MTQVLKLPAFRRLLVAYGLSQVAWAIVPLALAVLVYRRTGSAIGAAGFFLSAQFVPAFFSPAIVARVDRRSSRRVLPVLYLLEIGLFLLLALLFSRLPLGWVLWLAMVDGIIATVVRSLARAASASVTAPAGLLREGNALTLTVFSVSIMAGPALGGLLVGIGNIRIALLVASGLVAVIAITLGTARGLPEAVPEEDVPSKRRLSAALRYARRAPAIRALLVLHAVGLVFFTMSIPVEVVLAQHTLHAGAGGYGMLLTAWGGGAIAGSAMFARCRKRSVWVLIAVGAACLGGGFVVMAISPTLAVAAVGSAVAGAGNGIEGVATSTALQEQVKSQWLSLMMGLNVSMDQGLPGAGILLGGAAAQFGSPRLAFAVAGAGSLLIAAAICVFLRPLLGEGPAKSSEGISVRPLTFAGQNEHQPVDA